ncbi:hypothetical protein GCM10010168_29890 [Actinoplanes ianthinogenes]|uniref:STAS domain-containing protein n=1 Tax=Actinoplanes ianthinogenes TaxID=122358 RepID=A0ABM7LLG7_9ACTN|nr:STAS domain-containing protein [Actinoplanes ianthinogenes]BCJ40131.1 hypothetical protein Aiant_07880 [Actinoplanes ianthinogenes]GGR10471.1 hypothetical protein GCM10010168_29890 [Actinoplanes ianthinogenes]
MSKNSSADYDVIPLTGELDTDSAGELRQRLMSVASTSTASTIVLDLSRLDFISAGCVRVIVEFWNTMTGQGRDVQVGGLHGMPERVFDILDLTPILARRAETADGVRGVHAGD